MSDESIQKLSRKLDRILELLDPRVREAEALAQRKMRFQALLLRLRTPAREVLESSLPADFVHRPYVAESAWENLVLGQGNYFSIEKLQSLSHAMRACADIIDDIVNVVDGKDRTSP